MAKVDRIIELLENRIRRGDYVLRPLPAETRLADEVGVSRMTARKAISRLVDRGLLLRGSNGRLTVKLISAGDEEADDTWRKNHCDTETSDQHAHPMQLGFVAPAHGSAEIERWHNAVERATHQSGDQLRAVRFHHWNDPVLSEAVQSFDGIFLVPSAETVLPVVAERLRNGHAKVVALDCDMTPLGIRSIDLIPPSSVHQLLDHLAAMGHHDIDCLNVQPVDTVVEQRIEQWSLWRAAQRAGGELINIPDTSYGDPSIHAYKCIMKKLQTGLLKSSAMLCITMPAALGAMRAMYEKGLKVGKDISICAANDEGIAALLCPSLTCTRMPDPLPYLAMCLRWMAGEKMVGPMLTRPSEVPLFVGESSGAGPMVRKAAMCV